MNSGSPVDELLERRARLVVQIQFERLTRPDLSFCHNINVGPNARAPSGVSHSQLLRWLTDQPE